MSKIVTRTLEFLELFAEQRRPLSLSEVSRLLKLPVSSCHDVLRTLQDRGYAYQLSHRGGYYPTLRLRDLGRILAEHDPVVQRADAVLRQLRDAIDESILLSKVSGLRATYLLVFEPSHPLRFLARVGDPVGNLHATSAGKALLGSLAEGEFEAFLKAATLKVITPRTIKSKTALRSAIRSGNEKGWFLNDCETLEGVVTLSARFMWSGSPYIVTIAGPAARLTPRLGEASQLLREACRALEMRPEAPIDQRRGGAQRPGARPRRR